MVKNLKLSTYKPNFSDSRVRERAISVLEWCDGIRLSKREKPIHHDELTKVFGNHRRGFGKWLFARLMNQYGQYQVGKRSLSYSVKEDGYEKIHALLGTRPSNILECVQRNYASLISGDTLPAYIDNGGRRYHPVQNVQREIRRQAFVGWWDYDIEASAAALIYQYAAQHYRFVHGENCLANPFPAVARYINERAAIRAQIVDLVEVDVQQAKELVNALLFRANVAPSLNASIFSSLGGDIIRLKRLIQDEFVKEFRRDVKVMWRYAQLHRQREYALSKIDEYSSMMQQEFALRKQREYAVAKLFGGKPNKLSVSASKQRMAIYISLERQVVDAMLSVLNAKNIPVILMHDGFMLKRKVDVHELEAAVKNTTGFLIRLSESAIGGEKEIDDDPDDFELVQDGTGEDENIRSRMPDE